MTTEMRLDLIRALSVLTDRQLQVIKMRFFEDKTLDEIGSIIGVRGSRIHEIEAKSLRLLRRFMTANRLKLSDF